MVGTFYLCSTMSRASAGKTQRLRGDLKGWKLESHGGFLTPCWHLGWDDMKAGLAGAVEMSTYVGPLSGVGFSQDGGQVPRGTFLSMSVPGDPGGSSVAFCDLTSAVTEHHFFHTLLQGSANSGLMPNPSCHLTL